MKKSPISWPASNRLARLPFSLSSIDYFDGLLRISDTGNVSAIFPVEALEGYASVRLDDDAAEGLEPGDYPLLVRKSGEALVMKKPSDPEVYAQLQKIPRWSGAIDLSAQMRQAYEQAERIPEIALCRFVGLSAAMSLYAAGPEIVAVPADQGTDLGVCAPFPVGVFCLDRGVLALHSAEYRNTNGVQETRIVWRAEGGTLTTFAKIKDPASYLPEFYFDSPHTEVSNTRIYELSTKETKTKTKTKTKAALPEVEVEVEPEPEPEVEVEPKKRGRKPGRKPAAAAVVEEPAAVVAAAVVEEPAVVVVEEPEPKKRGRKPVGVLPDWYAQLPAALEALAPLGVPLTIELPEGEDLTRFRGRIEAGLSVQAGWMVRSLSETPRRVVTISRKAPPQP